MQVQCTHTHESFIFVLWYLNVLFMICHSRRHNLTEPNLESDTSAAVRFSRLRAHWLLAPSVWSWATGNVECGPLSYAWASIYRPA